mgnify:FL=1
MNKPITLEDLSQLKARGIINEAEFERRKKLLYQQAMRRADQLRTAKSGVVYILLAAFLGALGLHNFYARRPVRGFIQLFLSLISWLFMFLPLLFVCLWIYLEIMFTRRDGRGQPFRGSPAVIWLLRFGLTLYLAFALLNLQNSGELIFSEQFLNGNF